METRATFHETGGPEVIQFEEVELAPPAPGEVRMRNTAIGLNFIDTYHRSGLYPVELPSGLGSEAAGVVEAIGTGVEGFEIGDRVATFGPGLGAYATARNVKAESLFKLPETISDEIAAASLLKGLTAEFLAERCARLQSGDSVLVHAAAGGVGQILVQWLHHLGMNVIGTVGTPEKAALVRELGIDQVILYRDENVSTRVREITQGKGCQVVFDGVGKSTWAASLASTARRGMVISYGNASGPVENVNLGVLAQHGSLFVTRPTLFDYCATAKERASASARLFAMLSSGAVKISIGQRFDLKKAADAHRAIEAGETKGSTLLIP